MDLTGFMAARLNEDNAEALKLHDRLDGNVPLQRAFAARMLREVEAKRKILDEHAPGYPVTYPEPSGQPHCGVCHAGGWDWEPQEWPCATARALAAIYENHEDFDPAWKEQADG
jgi:hypothetical protein